MSIQNSGCNVPKTYKTSCKIRCQNNEQCNARQGCDKFLFAAIEEKKYQTKIYKNGNVSKKIENKNFKINVVF
jgi:hypothetical protein